MTNLSMFYLYTIFMNGRFGRGILMLYSLSLGLNALEFGFLQSAYNITRMLSEIPAGILADRINKKIILFLGALLNAVSSVGLWFSATHFTQHRHIILTILFMIDAFASVLASGADQALLFEELKKHQQEKNYLHVLSNTQTIALIVLASATALGGTFFQYLYANVFALQALCYILAALTILSLQSTTSTSDSIQAEQTPLRKQIHLVYQTLSNHHIILYLILAMTFIEVYVNSLVTFGQGAFASRGFSGSIIAIIIGGVTFGGILGAYCARFLDKISLRHFFIMVTGIFALATLTFSGSNKTLMVFGFTLANLLIDLTFPYVSSAINHSISNSNTIRSTILSVYSSLVGGLSLLLYPALGFLMDRFSYQTAYLTSGITITLVLAYLSFRTTKISGQQET